MSSLCGCFEAWQWRVGEGGRVGGTSFCRDRREDGEFEGEEREGRWSPGVGLLAGEA